MNAWIVSETAFDPTTQPHKETIFTIGNGYLGTRGAFEEGYPGAVPATLIHGIFDDVPIVYTELANCPDWLPLHIFVEGERFRLDQGTILMFHRQLDLRDGVLSRDVRWRSPAGHILDLHFARFASLADEHVVALRCTITVVDAPCALEVQASINGYPDNMGVMHWTWLDQSRDEATAWLHTRTRQTHIELGAAMRLHVSGTSAVIKALKCHNCPTLATSFTAQPGQPITLEKTITIFSSREAVQPVTVAKEKLAAQGNFHDLLTAQKAAWDAIWENSDIIIEGDPTAQRAIRHSLFQILAAVPRHDQRVSVSAKALSGFGYRGHVFWDTEIFLLPVLTYTQPELARNLLTYRYNTLPGARRKAQQNAYEGAMFAWESAATGDEVTPRWVPGLLGEEIARIWSGDIEQHITCDVAYAVWQYWRVTGDDAWMRHFGAEIILDTACFWASRVTWNAERACYEINDVVGPDEYHDHVNNNIFTNRMVKWHLRTALDTLAWLQETAAARATALSDQLHLTPERLSRWHNIAEKIVILQAADSQLMEQFEGFFDLKDINLADYEPRNRSMHSVLGIAEANAYQVLKQADVMMLLYLLRDDYDQQTLRVNWNYYNPRTDHTHGSSLSPAIHAALACMLDEPQQAYPHFMRAALTDLENVRHNTAEGIHAASAGGMWQALVFGFAGVRLTEAGPTAVPCLPAHWTRLKFRLNWHGRWIDFDIRSHPQPDDIQGIIFDLDGVLTDSSEFHYLGWQRLADEEGLPFDREANEALRGVSRRGSLMRLLNGRPATEEQIQEMMARKNHYYQDYIQQITPDNLLPGALQLLDELRQAEIKIGIGSSSKNAQIVLSKLGIKDRLTDISDGYSVQKHKPAPDLFLHAAAQLGLQPWQCVVVEDAAAGVQAARAGGMWTIGLGPQVRVGKAHLVFPSLACVRWADILEKLSTL